MAPSYTLTHARTCANTQTPVTRAKPSVGTARSPPPPPFVHVLEVTRGTQRPPLQVRETPREPSLPAPARARGGLGYLAAGASLCSRLHSPVVGGLMMTAVVGDKTERDVA